MAALAGCSSESSSSTRASEPIPIDRLDEEVVRAQCDLLFRCCDTTKLFTSAPSATRADCDALVAKDVVEDVAEMQAAVATGKVTYDGAAARECLNALATRPCSASESAPACKNVLKGAVADGQPCEGSGECASGFCARTCQRIPVVGEACEGFVCADGAYCDRMSFKCVAQKPTGSICESSEECVSESCDSMSSTCIAQKPDGSPCTGSSQCVSGFCDASGTCGPSSAGLCYPR